MLSFDLFLKFAALLAIILLPLFTPKKKKTDRLKGIGVIAVNNDGLLEQFAANNNNRHQHA